MTGYLSRMVSDVLYRFFLGSSQCELNRDKSIFFTNNTKWALLACLPAQLLVISSGSHQCILIWNGFLLRVGSVAEFCIHAIFKERITIHTSSLRTASKLVCDAWLVSFLCYAHCSLKRVCMRARSLFHCAYMCVRWSSDLFLVFLSMLPIATAVACITHTRSTHIRFEFHLYSVLMSRFKYIHRKFDMIQGAWVIFRMQYTKFIEPNRQIIRNLFIASKQDVFDMLECVLNTLKVIIACIAYCRMQAFHTIW